MEVSSLALFNNSNEILIVRDKEREYWTLPGGKVKFKETEKRAIKREMKEELPLVNYENLRFFGEFFGITPHSRQCIVIYVFRAFYVGGSIKPHREITGSKWIDEKEKEVLMTKATKNIINSLKYSKVN